MNAKKEIPDDNAKNTNLYAIHKKGLKSDDTKLYKDNRSLKSLRFSNSCQKTNQNKIRSTEKGAIKRNKYFEIFNDKANLKSSNIPYFQKSLEQINILIQNKKSNENTSNDKVADEKGNHIENYNGKINSKDSKSRQFPKSSSEFDEITHFSENSTKEKDTKKINKCIEFYDEKANSKTPEIFILVMKIQFN